MVFVVIWFFYSDADNPDQTTISEPADESISVLESEKDINKQESLVEENSDTG